MLAKIVSGMADGLLASVVWAWDTTGLIDAVNPHMGAGMGTEGAPVRKRIVVMNTAMWRQPVTARQIRVLKEEWGVGGGEDAKGKGSQEGWFEVLRPQEVGDGAMKD
jgi:phosphopantothenoylcysteine decarboxylase